ncbi:TPA: 30S ribosomal protein S4 [Candidatus Poribacteria bacterium]|nr:30S ribosomal protein S4 [Candidatus Poribacteria bacterium]HEX28501.1 30S ribosomal protein S4 [Candidatus Poribacteria bacterium]
MSKYLGPVCKLCRREGMKLFLKGQRCFTDKCAFERRPYPPGEHGRRSSKLSPYGIQLREKQKVKRLYGVLERQFKKYFRMAERQRGITGENLLRILESRLDNVVYRMGFASSRREARQLVHHGHFTVNGRRVDIPSYLVKAGDVIEVAPKSKQVERILNAIDMAQQRGVPEWIDVDYDQMKGTIRALPTRDQIFEDIQEQLIVELYSK